MRRLTLFIIIAATVIIAAIVLRDSQNEITNHPSGNSGIVAFGDSLVFGLGSSGGGFVSILSQKIGLPIINLGRNGDTTETALARVNVVSDRKPALTIILLGGNDYLQRIPHEKMMTNLEAIIKTVQASGSAVLLVGIEKSLIGNNESAIFESLAFKYRTAYVPDVLNGILGRQTLMADLLHPNDQGYALMAERILPVLKELIK